MRRTVRTVRLAAVAVAAVVLLSGCLRLDVTYLSHDELAGRQNGTPGSERAQDYLLGYLEAWTDGPYAGAGRAAYRQPFAGGTNLIGVIPGTTRPDEYVLVGAHYDHVGSVCRGSGPVDSICNGATDNAAGVGVALDVLRSLAYGPRPERSVIFAFWDREEDGLLGAAAFANDPIIPLTDVVTYVNFDIQGSNLRPSGRHTTFAIGGETGGPVLAAAIAAAAGPSTLDTLQLSLVFGLGRSDHAVLAARNVPVVFFTDSTGPCYHTVDDEIGVVDFDKLWQQSQTAQRLVHDLVNGPERATFATGLPLATYDDIVRIHRVLGPLQYDLDTFPPDARAQLLDRIAVVDAAVAGGRDNFPSVLAPTLLAINDIVGLVTTGQCDGFLAPAGS